MPEQADELDPLAPSPLELAVSALVVVHAALVAVVVVQLLRGKVSLPHGLLGLIVLLAVPVAGPLLVLTWQRVEPHRAQSQHSVS